MNRRNFLLSSAALAASAFLPNVSSASSKPNIVLILADDLDSKLGTLDYMPRIAEHLSGRGVTFTNCIANCPLCVPSRTSILTGKCAHNHGVVDNTGGFGLYCELGLEGAALPELLRADGYRTGIYGKYMNGFTQSYANQQQLTGWDEWAVITGTPSYYDFTLSVNGTPMSFPYSDWHYLTDVLARRSAAFINRNCTTPFFLYIPTYAPHGPADPASIDAESFSDIRAPQTPSFNEADVSDKPEYIRNLPLIPNDKFWSLNELYRNRLRSMLSVDRLVESVVSALETAGVLDNTYIVFTSDNGFHIGQHRMPRGKSTPYEEDIVVPLIVRGPGIVANTRTGVLTSLIDLAPTILNWAGAVVPGDMDGSELPRISGEALRQVVPACMPTWRALRFADYKYVEHTSGEREIYDLIADPHELNNIYASEWSGTKRLLEHWADALFSSSGVELQQCAAGEIFRP